MQICFSARWSSGHPNLGRMSDVFYPKKQRRLFERLLAAHRRSSSSELSVLFFILAVALANETLLKGTGDICEAH